MGVIGWSVGRGGRTRAIRRGGAAAAAVLAIGAGVAAPGAAFAASGPFQIGTFPTPPNEVELPSVAVDANGTGYVAWLDTGQNVVDYCVLPDGATACAPSGTLTPVVEPGTNEPAPAKLSGSERVEVSINDGTVSIITDVQGEPNNDQYPQETEMWEAPDGTANFTLVNGGNSVAFPTPQGTQSSYLEDGVTVPGTDELGEFDSTPSGPPTFEAFTQSNPPTCSEATSPACAFATLEPSSNPDPVSNFGELLGRQVASESAPTPGILAVDYVSDTSGPFACVDAAADNFSLVYMYGSGLQSATNSYSISPGQPNSAWKVAATAIPGQCPYHDFAIAGGPSGLGLLQATSGGFGVSYLPFDAATAAFDEPAVSIDPTSNGTGLALGQDGSGNLYATAFVSTPGASGGDYPLALYYSSDGGKTWQGPAPLETTAQTGFNRAEIGVGSGGKGWMAITANGQLSAVEFSAADAQNAFSAAVSPPPPVTGSDVTVGLSCYTTPCTVSTSLSTGGASTASVGHVAGSQTIGTGTLQITQPGVHDVQIPLTPAGVAELHASGGKLTAALSESTAVGAYVAQKSVAVTLTEPPAPPAPVLSKLKISPRTVIPAARGAAVASARTGASVSYHLSAAALTTFVVFKPEAGVRKKGVCVVTHSDAGRHAPHGRGCTLQVQIGQFLRPTGTPGANTFHFTGRIGGKALKPGSYVLKASPSADQLDGLTVSVTFTVARRR